MIRAIKISQSSRPSGTEAEINVIIITRRHRFFMSLFAVAAGVCTKSRAPAAAAGQRPQYLLV